MGLKAIVKKGFSFGFQPKRWMGVDQVAAQGETCLKLVKDMLKPAVNPEVVAQEAAASNELKQDATALAKRQRFALSLWVAYFLTGLCGLGYSLYLVLARALYLPASVTCMVSLLLFVYALREFMVYGQIRCGGDALPLKALLKKLLAASKASS